MVSKEVIHLFSDEGIRIWKTIYNDNETNTEENPRFNMAPHPIWINGLIIGCPDYSIICGSIATAATISCFCFYFFAS